MTDLTEHLEKVAIRCTSCGKYRAHTEFKAPLTAQDDPRKPVCDSCRNPAAKGVIRHEPRVFNLAPAKKSNAIAVALNEIAANQPQMMVKAANPANKADRIWAGAMMLAKAWAAELDTKVSKSATRESLAKAEATRQRVAKIQAKTERLRRKAEESTMAKALAEQKLADLLAQQANLTAEIAQLGKRADAVFANAERAFGGVAKQREMQAIADLAKQDQERAAWAEKAGQTNDPDLRAYYLAKATGEDLDDD